MYKMPVRKPSSPPYEDADGYLVLSAIIDPMANKSKSESVSIVYQTISEEALKGIRFQCSGSFPSEFWKATEDFDRKAKTKFVLQRAFELKKKYVLFASSRASFANAGNQTQAESAAGVFSVSAVGFDETKTHAIALVRHIVHIGGTAGGDSSFYLLRKTEYGWHEATEIPKCGRIY